MARMINNTCVCWLTPKCKLINIMVFGHEHQLMFIKCCSELTSYSVNILTFVFAVKVTVHYGLWEKCTQL